MDLEASLGRFFATVAPLAPGDRVLLAFSGGGDSTALLAALRDFGHRLGVDTHAAHIDHGLDPGSRCRAASAADIAHRLGVKSTICRRNVPHEKYRGESLEVAARRVRYRELERLRLELGARYIATAHHLDDQAETVLLRMASGHGIAALAAIPAQRGHLVRPFLNQRRSDLTAFARSLGLEWIEDPANSDLTIPRNRLRHLLLPALERDQPALSEQLAGLARSAGAANRRVSAVLEDRLEPRIDGRAAHVLRATLAGCPHGLLPWAVTHLLRRCGATRRPSKRALAHLQRHLVSNLPIDVDLGGGWRAKDSHHGEIRIGKRAEKIGPFAYNLEVPGEVRLDELACLFRLRAGRCRPWMFRGAPKRAGLCLPFELQGPLTVRNRRPGDRVQPLGSVFRRKLKDLLIDRQIPRYERDRLPLLCHSDRILWVPGVTIDHEARIQEHSKVWVAEIIPDE